MVVLGILATAFAQILLKKASYHDIRSTAWLLYMGVSAVSYAFSFILYSRILKHFALNKVYTVMTVGQIILVTVYGLWIGEAITGRHAIGLLLGGLAIYLILT
jgi:multidrug transporter EmrE-like cation transporter